jgi:hypothetical protein
LPLSESLNHKDERRDEKGNCKYRSQLQKHMHHLYTPLGIKTGSVAN